MGVSPKQGVSIVGVPIIRTTIFSIFLGSPYFGKLPFLFEIKAYLTLVSVLDLLLGIPSD